jgi:hypothetical protein
MKFVKDFVFVFFVSRRFRNFENLGLKVGVTEPDWLFERLILRGGVAFWLDQ